MYAYVFDSFVQDQKYRTESTRIETRLATLGIQGRSEKITVLKNVQESVRNMLKRGAETIVAVGNDQTISKILPLIIEADVALGIIPVGPHQLVAHALGLPDGLAACDMLSRRIMRRIDLGLVAGTHFLLRADIPVGAKVECDKAYTVESTDPEAALTIYNIGTDGIPSRPDDGRLELVVGASAGSWFGRTSGERSVFPLKSAHVSQIPGDGKIILDGQLGVHGPVTISVLRQKLHVIVGRDRQFE